jgi:hypothetical protein
MGVVTAPGRFRGGMPWSAILILAMGEERSTGESVATICRRRSTVAGDHATTRSPSPRGDGALILTPFGAIRQNRSASVRGVRFR